MHPRRREKAKNVGFKAQFKQHSVAVISLLVALSALGYNTWRNEQSEQNRNIRAAGFEMLLHIGELQRITYLAHYDKDTVTGSPRNGWVEVLTLRDLAELMSESTQREANALHSVWTDHWKGVGTQDQSVEAIDNALDKLRTNVVQNLDSLD